ncbi:MAG TPA: tRNA (uridine(54)-C5)-methyltransferase TrmA [Porticoccaceae bacterium]|nr:tRNA (uridine(54)-C5)-methyltransferase TrmA [Porticoccaceae bacterium]
MPESRAPVAPTTSLDDKLQALRVLFGDCLPAALEIHRSPETGYRMRAEFRIWHQHGQCHYAMYPKGGGEPYVIADFPPGSATIARLMPALRAAINAEPILRLRLYSTELLTTTSGEAVITLVYHRRLDDPWRAAATELATRLGCHVIGRSRGQKEVVGADHVTESLRIGDRTFQWRQYESAFTQPNAAINREMLDWAARHCRGLGGDLLELYCGNGNFTLVLAQEYRRVLATEVAKLGVLAARHNLATNGVTNVELVRMASAEVGEALAGVRPFRRLRHLDLASYRFTTLLVDPPRAGLDDTTIALARNFDNILYISCNPITLRENIEQFKVTHEIKSGAVFDQFPGTPHLECGLLLTRR